MTLPAHFALLNSAYNDFLFAPIGEEANNGTLTVLSALTRLELDPWEEAARLAALPEAAARDALARLIQRIPGELRSPAEAAAVAARLIASLPTHDHIAPLSGVASAVRSRLTGPQLLWVAVGLGVLLVLQRVLF